MLKCVDFPFYRFIKKKFIAEAWATRVKYAMQLIKKRDIVI